MYDAAAINIPRIIHVIWIGDERKRQDHNIATWRDNHPAWEFRLWGQRRTWSACRGAASGKLKSTAMAAVGTVSPT
jgi:hypothetical protein